MISKDSASKNKRKSSKSLLIRLSESCNSHRTKFHNPDDDHDIDCDDSDPSPQCESDMKALKYINKKQKKGTKHDTDHIKNHDQVISAVDRCYL